MFNKDIQFVKVKKASDVAPKKQTFVVSLFK